MESRKVSIIVLIIFSLLTFGSSILWFIHTAINHEPIEIPPSFVIVDARVESISESFRADVQFEYEGKTVKGYVADAFFKSAGDNIEVLYNPYTGKVKRNNTAFENLISKIEFLPSVTILTVSIFFFILPTILVLRTERNFYRKENLVSGVVVEIQERKVVKYVSRFDRMNTKRNITRKRIICTFTSPDTGMPVTIYRDVPSNVQVYEGQFVDVYYYKKNPTSSVIDI